MRKRIAAESIAAGGDGQGVDVMRLTGQRQPQPQPPRAQQGERGAEGEVAQARKRGREGGSGGERAAAAAAAAAPALAVESKVEAAKRRFLERKRARAM